MSLSTSTNTTLKTGAHTSQSVQELMDTYKLASEPYAFFGLLVCTNSAGTALVQIGTMLAGGRAKSSPKMALHANSIIAAMNELIAQREGGSDEDKIENINLTTVDYVHFKLKIITHSSITTHTFTNLKRFKHYLGDS